MSELTMDEALVHVALAEAMVWCQQVNGTLRFFDDTDGPQLRLAVHSDEHDPAHVDVAVVPIANATLTSLALSLRAAQGVIEPQIRRRTLRAVP